MLQTTIQMQKILHKEIESASICHLLIKYFSHLECTLFVDFSTATSIVIYHFLLSSGEQLMQQRKIVRC